MRAHTGRELRPLHGTNPFQVVCYACELSSYVYCSTLTACPLHLEGMPIARAKHTELLWAIGVTSGRRPAAPLARPQAHIARKAGAWCTCVCVCAADVLLRTCVQARAVAHLQEALEQDARWDEVLGAPHGESKVHGAVRQVVAAHGCRCLVRLHAPATLAAQRDEQRLRALCS